MLTFLEETLNDITTKHSQISELILILPSKRAGGFLLNYLRNNSTTTYLAPKIISIEEFIEMLSGVSIIDTTELLFKSYEAYLKLENIKEKESFDSYSGWATTLLGDFNEIDRYLLDTKPFFNYLSDIQDVNHWYVKNERTPLIEKYLAFWNSLHEFYDILKNRLLKENIGYQGLVYRKAAEEIEHYTKNHSNKKHIFIGFNALNTAEQQIIQELLETGNTSVYWDTDHVFFNDTSHSASLFLRSYKENWKYYQSNPFETISNTFENAKKFTLVETQKNISQVKYVGQILEDYSTEKLNNTAIILADENMLIPLLHSLPNTIDKVNITMGVPLKTFPYALFFDILLRIKSIVSQTYYYKDIIAIIEHPFLNKAFPLKTSFISKIKRNNITHISVNKILDGDQLGNIPLQNLLFSDWNDKSNIAIKNCIKIIEIVKEVIDNTSVDAVVLFQLHGIFMKIDALQSKFSYLSTVATVQKLFSELISGTTLDFQGDAYEGLQIMGVLESRVLDFENIIITSVNEGILPSGKSNASFITYDLKHQYNLPKFTEKDAIYSYHFTHLLHRAKEVTFLYNTFSEGVNTGEMSRFLLQLDINNLPQHTLEKIVLSPSVSLKAIPLKKIQKTTTIKERLKEMAKEGFSPSSLTSYIRNPLEFYFEKILGIRENNEVEETVAANTMGTIVHETLEKLYQPLITKKLTTQHLKELLTNIDSEVRKQFALFFKEGDYSKGKNLLIFEVSKKFVSNFIHSEIKEVEAGNEILLLKLETKLSTEITIDQLNFPVKIKGTVDRIDQYNGQLRIIDYKTGKVEQKQLNLKNWEALITNYEYSKAFQVLMYVLMYTGNTPFESIEGGIISFKNLNNGFLKFSVTEEGSNVKKQHIDQEVITIFKQSLKALITEICNPEIPFIEKEIETHDY